MTRHEFLALMIASPLALLIGKWKQGEQYNIYCDTLPEWHRRLEKQLAFMRGEQWNLAEITEKFNRELPLGTGQFHT